MNLSFEQIKSITCGAVDVIQTVEGVCFHRFTQAQRSMYQRKNTEFFLKSFGTAGVKLSFRTDSKRLGLRATVQKTCTRTYASFDVTVNGVAAGYLDNFSDVEIQKDYSRQEFPLGEMEKEFDLGEGVKTVEVHFPWNLWVVLHEIFLDDGASVVPVRPQKKLLAFGDSITQGFDALRPSRRYVAQLANALEAEEFNKAIGGECFCPDLAAIKDDFAPDYITVAYGTNDWSKTKPETLQANARAFFLELQNHYPGVKTYVLTPIWRANEESLAKTRKPFYTVGETIADVTADLENIAIIPGYDLVPHSVDYFGDYGLHPRNEGFDHYFENIWKTIR